MEAKNHITDYFFNNLETSYVPVFPGDDIGIHYGSLKSVIKKKVEYFCDVLTTSIEEKLMQNCVNKCVCG